MPELSDRSDGNVILERHFQRPRRVGRIEDPDGVGHVGNPLCGDVVNVYVRIHRGVVAEARFEAVGCPVAIAAASATADLARGRAVDVAASVDVGVVAAALGGVPEASRPCVRLALRALATALADAGERGAHRGRGGRGGRGGRAVDRPRLR